MIFSGPSLQFLLEAALGGLISKPVSVTVTPGKSTLILGSSARFLPVFPLLVFAPPGSIVAPGTGVPLISVEVEVSESSDDRRRDQKVSFDYGIVHSFDQTNVICLSPTYMMAVSWLSNFSAGALSPPQGEGEEKAGEGEESLALVIVTCILRAAIL